MTPKLPMRCFEGPITVPEATPPATGPNGQQARSEVTRARVLDAAVACIAETGFGPANLAGIAERAGLTTGAIQHQFGDKATLLAAVVERGFERLVERAARLPGGAVRRFSHEETEEAERETDPAAIGQKGHSQRDHRERKEAAAALR